MDGTVGRINCFIVEPFVPHDDEYYLCAQLDFDALARDPPADAGQMVHGVLLLVPYSPNHRGQLTVPLLLCSVRRPQVHPE